MMPTSNFSKKGVDAENMEVKSSSLNRFSINLRTLHCKAISFFMYSIVGTIIAFQNVFLVSVGMPVGQTGLITGIGFIASTLAGPCWGALADKTGYRKTIFTLLSLGILLTFFSTPFVARELQASISSHLNSNHSHVNVNAANLTHDSALLQPSTSSSPIFLYTVAAILIIGYSCLFTMLSFVDSAIMNVLETMKSKEGFGQQTMFGSLGVGLTCFMAGYAADQFEHRTLSKYTAIYFVLLPYTMIGVPLILFIFRYTNWEIEGIESEKKSTSVDLCETNILIMEKTSITADVVEGDSVLTDAESNCKNENALLKCYKGDNLRVGTGRITILKDILTQTDNIFLMSTTLFLGTVQSYYFGFLFLTIKDEMHGSRSLMGLCMVVNSISSAIMFYFTKRFIKVIGGTFISVAISVFAWVIRLFLLSIIKKAWLAAVVPQLLHSFCWSLFWSAMVQHIHHVSNKEVYITMYTILTSLYLGAGGFLGNFIGGKVYMMYGGPVVLRGTAVLTLCWFVLLFVYHYRLILFKKCVMSKAVEKNAVVEDGCRDV